MSLIEKSRRIRNNSARWHCGEYYHFNSIDDFGGGRVEAVMYHSSYLWSHSLSFCLVLSSFLMQQLLPGMHVLSNMLAFEERSGKMRKNKSAVPFSCRLYIFLDSIPFKFHLHSSSQDGIGRLLPIFRFEIKRCHFFSIHFCLLQRTKQANPTPQFCHKFSL